MTSSDVSIAAIGPSRNPWTSLAELQEELDRGLVAIIADASGFHGLITRVDLLNHLRRTLA